MACIDRLTNTNRAAANVETEPCLHAAKTTGERVVLELVEHGVELLNSDRGDSGRDFLCFQELGKELALLAVGSEADLARRRRRVRSLAHRVLLSLSGCVVVDCRFYAHRRSQKHTKEQFSLQRTTPKQ